MMAALLSTFLLGANADIKHCASMYDEFGLGGDAYHILVECTWYNKAVNVLSDFMMAAWFGGIRDAALVGHTWANGGYKECGEENNLPQKKNDWNDRVSSVYVMPGCKMQLFEHDDKYHWFFGWMKNRGQMGSTFLTGHIYNLYDPFNNKVSKFHCWCESDEWNNFWAAWRLAGGRRRTESSTGTASEPLLDLQQATTSSTDTASLPTGFDDNGETLVSTEVQGTPFCINDIGPVDCETGTQLTTADVTQG